MQTEDIEENAISLASVNNITFLDNNPANLKKNPEFIDPRMIPESPKSDEDLNDSSKESNENIRNWLQRITQIQSEIQRKITSEQNQFPEYSKPSATNTNKVVKYQDLPYMGEMTLDNSKPRRGRKPKKADICHLIYKNYGTIYPGTPKNLVEPKKADKPEVNEVVNRSDVQNKIISSLLERRLTQESKKQRMTPPNQDEPLNLCIRDLNHLKIRLKPNETSSEIKSEPQSDDDVEFVHETPSPGSGSASSKEMKFPTDFEGKGDSAPGGYVYWPSAGVFIHPMALQQQLMYYQKLAGGNSYTLPNKPETPPNDAEKKLTLENKRKDEEEEQKIKRNAPSTSSDKTPMKRKRSAIFIPPIPAENQTNPATEVSICKFKFTGGAKPSLQEKKMLSVDSGGNFTYYSGTGDKSMRGYEFFPRQTLQQQISTQGSSTGAFLQVSGEKIFPPSPSELPPKPQNEFVLAPEVQPPQITLQDLGPRNKKRKSRKSLQREKLEQTFKEKGFLIQTQQLESAEGATYCKFRQLRKFTRYLFRSWKDYLPGMANEEESRRSGVAEETNDNDVDLENSLSNSDMNTELNN
ncbi:uncharacterized protein [Onthophagus taurus]|nr:uncharacterized protein LOC111415522 isoform X2 [Onthophagus taurus]XP_022903021.1 uncharacterized protein LOC111415522 isoform X2 [Onthophagus taurus]